MSYEIRGKLHKKYDTNEVNERFKKREFVLSTEDGGYQQFIKLQLTQDRCSLIDSFEEGEELLVTFDIRGNEYTNPKGEILYFTNLNAWKVSKAAAEAVKEEGKGDMDFPTTESIPEQEFEDDLPF